MFLSASSSLILPKLIILLTQYRALVSPFIDGYNSAINKCAYSLLEVLKLSLLDGETLEQYNRRQHDLQVFTASFSTMNINHSTPAASSSGTRPETPPPMYTPTPSTPARARVHNTLPFSPQLSLPPTPSPNETESAVVAESDGSDVEVIGVVHRHQASGARCPTTPGRVRARSPAGKYTPPRRITRLMN